MSNYSSDIINAATESGFYSEAFFACKDEPCGAAEEAAIAIIAAAQEIIPVALAQKFARARQILMEAVLDTLGEGQGERRVALLRSVIEIRTAEPGLSQERIREALNEAAVLNAEPPMGRT